MPLIVRNGFHINYEITCPGDGPVLMLVAGLGEQIGTVEYPEAQCARFAEKGFRVVRMDNRDQGLSLPIGKGNIPAYTLHDMADDVAAIAADIGCRAVHLVGASLGGFIARWAAIRHPTLISTLTVVMSGSGAGPDDDGPQRNTEEQNRMAAMFERRDRAEQIEWSTNYWRHIWGDGYPFPRDWVKARVTAGLDRAYRPEAIARAMDAARNTPGLWQAQIAIKCPTLVMHGGSDPIFSAAHGQAIAESIPGAKLWLDPRMGHIMHEQQWEEMAGRVAILSRSGFSA